MVMNGMLIVEEAVSHARVCISTFIFYVCSSQVNNLPSISTYMYKFKLYHICSVGTNKIHGNWRSKRYFLEYIRYKLQIHTPIRSETRHGVQTGLWFGNGAVLYLELWESRWWLVEVQLRSYWEFGILRVCSRNKTE